MTSEVVDLVLKVEVVDIVLKAGVGEVKRGVRRGRLGRRQVE